MERSEGARGSLFFFEPLSTAEAVTHKCDLTFVSGWWIFVLDYSFDVLNLLGERRGRVDSRWHQRREERYFE